MISQPGAAHTSRLSRSSSPVSLQLSTSTVPELISGSCVLTPSRSVKQACAFAGSRSTIVPGFNAFSSSCSRDEACGTCDRVCGDAVWE